MLRLYDVLDWVDIHLRYDVHTQPYFIQLIVRLLLLPLSSFFHSFIFRLIRLRFRWLLRLHPQTSSSSSSSSSSSEQTNGNATHTNPQQQQQKQHHDNEHKRDHASLIIRAERASFTSMYVTYMRYQSYVCGRCDDSLAGEMLDTMGILLMIAWRLNAYCSGVFRVKGTLSARVNYGDRKIAEAIRNKRFEQIVILGAGNDTRFHRLHQLLQSYNSSNSSSSASSSSSSSPTPLLIEVDAPSTQLAKIAALSRARIPCSDDPHERKWRSAMNPSVHFVSVDFTNRETNWLQRLEEEVKSFQRNRRTLFIWEGVTYYLPSDAIRATLQNIADCAVGSEVVLDYAHMTPAQLSVMNSLLSALGEPWSSTFSKDSLQELMKHHHMNLLDVVKAEEYDRLYPATVATVKQNKNGFVPKVVEVENFMYKGDREHGLHLATAVVI